MTIKNPLWLENLSYSATDMRSLLAAIYHNQGALKQSDLKVSQRGAGANRSVDVAAGMAVVNGSLSEQESYLFWSDAVVNVPLAAAPGAGQSRIDLIVVTIQDQDQDGGLNNDGIITVVTGTAAATGSQVAPATPASSLLLAQVLVGPAVTSIVNANITDFRTFAHQRGNFIGEVKLWTSPTLPTDEGGWEWVDGSAVSRSVYAGYMSKVGTVWGVGDGSTTVNKPDLQDVFPIGAGGSYALASSGGEAEHTLTDAEMPVHDHGGATGTHHHDSVAGFEPVVQTGSTEGLATPGDGDASYAVGAETSDATASISNDGGGDPHNNLPPYKGINFIILMR